MVGPCKSDGKKFGPISVRFFFSSGEYLIAKSSTRLDLYNRRSDLFFSVRFTRAYVRSNAGQWTVRSNNAGQCECEC